MVKFIALQDEECDMCHAEIPRGAWCYRQHLQKGELYCEDCGEEYDDIIED